jgi:hypothetical protein
MTYHLHLGILQFLTIFIGSVLLIGTLWRLLAAWLMTLDSPFGAQLGAAMAFMY